jgi:hypothetical protein
VNAAMRLSKLIARHFSEVKIEIGFDIGSGNIEIPSDLGSFIGHRVHFYTSCESLVVPYCIDFIGRFSFQFCYSLRRVIIGHDSHLKAINGFRECPLLEYVEIGPSVEIILRRGFHNSKSLKVVCIAPGSQLRSIHGFIGCSSLASIAVPASVELMNSCAFAYDLVRGSVHLRVFILSDKDEYLWRSRRRCHLFTSRNCLASHVNDHPDVD